MKELDIFVYDYTLPKSSAQIGRTRAILAPSINYLKLHGHAVKTNFHPHGFSDEYDIIVVHSSPIHIHYVDEFVKRNPQIPILFTSLVTKKQPIMQISNTVFKDLDGCYLTYFRQPSEIEDAINTILSR